MSETTECTAHRLQCSQTLYVDHSVSLSDKHNKCITFQLAVLAYLTDVSTTWRRVTSPPISTRRATLVTGSVYARFHRPCSIFLRPNTWPSVAMHSVQLQLVYGTVCQQQCRHTSHWTFFDASWKLNCSHVLTTDTAPVKRLYCCVTHFHFLQTRSLSTIMLLRHSFLKIRRRRRNQYASPLRQRNTGRPRAKAILVSLRDS